MNQIFEILSECLSYGEFSRVLSRLSKVKPEQAYLAIYMRSLSAKFHPSCFKTEGGDRNQTVFHSHPAKNKAACVSTFEWSTMILKCLHVF